MNDPTPRLPSPASGLDPATAGADSAAEFDGSTASVPEACPGRGVLDGAFAVLDALAHAGNGMGLTALARASGLAKTSAYRLAEQLVDLGAVERIGHRYYVGPRVANIGRRWLPDPQLREISQAPVHALAVHARCDMTALVILDGDRMRVVSATARLGGSFCPDALDAETVARTAAGRILYAARSGDAALPGCWTPSEWRQLREHIRDLRATVADHQDAVPGICSVSAAVWYPNGDCAGALFALMHATTLSPRLPGLVLHAARRIDAALR
jgi:IclR family transcriptional regulator, acetate operon repressor